MIKRLKCFVISHAGTVVPECYKDDVESQWKSLKFDPRHPKTPETMATKIGRGDYVPDIYPCAKLHFDPIRGFCPPHMRSCLPNVHSASYRASICEGGLGSRNSVCLSVRPSVCLSHAWIVTKLNVALQIFYTTRKGNHSATQVPRVVGGRHPFLLKSALKVTHPLREMPTSTDFRS